MGERGAVRTMWTRGLASLLHGGSAMAPASCWDSEGQSGWPRQGGFSLCPRTRCHGAEASRATGLKRQGRKPEGWEKPPTPPFPSLAHRKGGKEREKMTSYAELSTSLCFLTFRAKERLVLFL